MQKDGRYQDPLLWKEKMDSFPNNYSMVLKSFNMLRKRLKRDKVLKEKYKNTMTIQVNKVRRKDLMCQWRHGTYNIILYWTRTNPRTSEWCFIQLLTQVGNNLKNSLLTGSDILNSLIGVLLHFWNLDIYTIYQQARVISD